MSGERLRWTRPEAGNALLLLYLVGIWLTIHWYQGITHDAVLYAGQALARLHPDLKRDLFFAYGSQDDYTVFTPVFAALAARLSMDEAALLLLLAAHIVWVTGAIAVARSLATGSALWLGLVLAFGTTGMYGPERIFSYGEGFLTARVWAEALGLFAIAASINGRRALAVGLGIASMALHPIIGLAVAGFVAFNGFTWRQLLAAGAVAGLAAVLGAGLGLFSPAPLWRLMDPEWYAIITRRAPYVLIDRWRAADLSEVLCLFSLLFLAAAMSEGRIRRAWLAIGLTALLGMTLTAIGAATHHALLIQAQTWRVLWLVRLMAPLAAAWLLFALWPKGPEQRLTVLWLLIAWLVRSYWGGAIALAVVALHLWRREQKPVSVPRSVMLASGAALALAAANSLVAATQEFLYAYHFYRASADPTETGLFVFYAFTASFGAAIFAVLFIPVRRLACAGGAPQALLAAILLAFGLSAATHWDQRRPIDRDLYSGLAGQADALAEFLPAGATIYTQNTFQNSWFGMQRPNYASGQQGTSALFSRDAAVETRRRLARLARLNTFDSSLDWVVTPKTETGAGETLLSLDGVVHLCGDPILDFVILAADVGGGTARPFPRGDGWQRYVYDCAALRSRFADPFPGQQARHPNR